MGRKSKGASGSATLADVMPASLLAIAEAVQDMEPVTEHSLTLGNATQSAALETVHENMPAIITGSVHVGPLSRAALSEIIRSENASVERVCEQDFIDGFLTLIRADIEHNPTLVEIGAVVVWFDTLNSLNQDKVLARLCEHPLSAETMIDPETPTVLVKHTGRERLAHAIYSERFPELWGTFIAKNKGQAKQRKAVKRLENAKAAYMRVTKEEQALASESMVRELAAAVPELRVDNIPDGAPTTVLADKTVVATSSLVPNLDASKSKAKPKSIKDLFPRLYDAARADSPEETLKNRQKIDSWFLAIGFTADELVKWRNAFLSGDGAKLDVKVFKSILERQLSEAPAVATEAEAPVLEDAPELEPELVEA